MIVYERKFFAQIYFLHRERSVTGFRTQESEWRGDSVKRDCMKTQTFGGVTNVGKHGNNGSELDER